MQSRDSTPIGAQFQPPAFFGVHPEPVNITEDAFSSQGWIDHCNAQFDRMGSVITTLKNGVKELLGRSILPLHLRLPQAEMEALIERNGRVSVIDVGGGFGDNYYLLAQRLVSHKTTYHVVDNARQCDLGRRFYAGNGPEFHTEIPPETEFDLAIVVGTLQYIPDWKGFLKHLSTIADAVYIARTPLNMAGPTFHTVQSIAPASGKSKGRKIGEANVTVISEKELEDVMADCGYTLAESRLNTDYSHAFARLPESHRNVAYVDKLWRQTLE
jgi:putative methyltransferase (TIGR04325 family)